MKTANLLLPTLLAATNANAALRDDLTNLKESIASVTSTLIEFQNETGPVNTAAMIQSIGWQVGASMANLGCGATSLPKANASNNTQSLQKTERVYLQYIDTLTNLSDALSDRGRLPHDEPDTPVVQNTQSLTRALYLFAKCLYNGNYISQDAAIDTWNAEGDLQQATSEWEEMADSSSTTVKERERKNVRRASCESLKH